MRGDWVRSLFFYNLSIDASLFPPNLSKDEKVYSYNADMCRWVAKKNWKRDPFLVRRSTCTTFCFFCADRIICRTYAKGKTVLCRCMISISAPMSSTHREKRIEDSVAMALVSVMACWTSALVIQVGKAATSNSSFNDLFVRCLGFHFFSAFLSSRWKISSGGPRNDTRQY